MSKKKIQSGKLGSGTGTCPYGQRFRRECKLIYMEQRTLAGVIRTLKARGYKHPPNRKTLTEWRDEEGWKEALTINDQIAGAEDLEDKDELEKLLAQVQTMRNVAYKKIVRENDGVFEIKESNSQDFYAYNRLAQTEGLLIENLRKARAAEAVKTPVEAIFSALKKHPKIGKLLSRRDVLEEVQSLIAEEKLAYARREVGLA